MRDAVVVGVVPHQVADAVDRHEPEVNGEVGAVVRIRCGVGGDGSPRQAVVVGARLGGAASLVRGLGALEGVGGIERHDGRCPAARGDDAVVVVVGVGIGARTVNCRSKPRQSGGVGTGVGDTHHVVTCDEVFEGVLAVGVSRRSRDDSSEGGVGSGEKLHLYACDTRLVRVCDSVVLVCGDVRGTTVVVPHQVADAVHRYVHEAKVDAQLRVSVVVLVRSRTGVCCVLRGSRTRLVRIGLVDRRGTQGRRKGTRHREVAQGAIGGAVIVVVSGRDRGGLAVR